MSKRKRSRRAAKAAPRAQARARRERIAAVALLAASFLSLFWVIAAKPVLGVAGQHDYPYHPAPQHTSLVLLALLALPLAATLAYVLFSARQLSRTRVAVLVALFAASTLILGAGAALAPDLWPGAQLVWPFFWLNTEGAYANEVYQVSSVERFLAGYANRLERSGAPGSPHKVHVDTHPPGLILGFVALERLHDACPKLREAARGWAARNLPSSWEAVRGVAPVGERKYFANIRHPLPVGLTAALVVVVLPSLVPLLAFATARQFLAAEPSLVVAGLCALLPALYLFSPSVDQVYPLLTLLICCPAIRAVATRRLRWGFLAGLALYAAAFLHVGFGLVMVILGLAALAAWRSHTPETSLAQLVRAYWRPVAGVALGFLAPAIVLWVWVGYPTFRVVWLCLRNNGRYYAQVKRSYWPWVALSPFEFALSFGFALTFLAAATWLREAVAACRERSLAGRSALLVVAGAVLLALDLAGMTRGETPRLWLFLMPLLVLGIVDHLWRRATRPGCLVAATAAAQAIQLVAFAVLLDLGHTTNFFWRLLTPS